MTAIASVCPPFLGFGAGSGADAMPAGAAGTLGGSKVTRFWFCAGGNGERAGGGGGGVGRTGGGPPACLASAASFAEVAAKAEPAGRADGAGGVGALAPGAGLGVNGCGAEPPLSRMDRTSDCMVRTSILCSGGRARGTSPSPLPTGGFWGGHPPYPWLSAIAVIIAPRGFRVCGQKNRTLRSGAGHIRDARQVSAAELL